MSRLLAFLAAAILGLAPGLALAQTINNGVTTPYAGTFSAARLQANGADVVQQFYRVTVDFNQANTDFPVTITLPTGYTRYRVAFSSVTGASATINTATAGIFTGAGGTGTAIVTTTAVNVSSTAETTNGNELAFTVNNPNSMSIAASTLYVRVSTAQGSPVTATVTIQIQPLS